MATDLVLPPSFGALPKAVAGQTFSNDELSAGVSASYAVMGYRGKVWAVKFGGNEAPLMRDDGDGPRNSIEVVIVKASPAISKIYYKNGYTDGANQPPDCWSGNGVTPDASVQNKVSPTCANCPMNAWGSRTTEAGKQAKACADSRRTAIVPLNDLDNEAFGGPMLLRIPAASLKDLKAYADLLTQHQFPYFAAATRISFDPAEAFPKFVFSAIRPLTEEEAAKVVAMREDKRIATVLAENAAPVTADGVVPEAAKPVPSSPFEQPAPVTPASNPDPAQAAPAPKPEPKKPEPKKAPPPPPPPAPAPAMARPSDPSHIHAAGTPDELWWDGTAWIKPPATTTAPPPPPPSPAPRVAMDELMAGIDEDTGGETGVGIESEGDDNSAKFDAMLDGLLETN